eukprot:scaffold120005_cov16-Prasinocladus_malaysianus.AAC.1
MDASMTMHNDGCCSSVDCQASHRQSTNNTRCAVRTSLYISKPYANNNRSKTTVLTRDDPNDNGLWSVLTSIATAVMNIH